MEKLNIIELIALIEKGQEQKAAGMVSAFLDGLAPAERGATYISMASVYMKMLAENQQKVTTILKEQLQRLKQLKISEIKESNDLDIESVRQQL